MKKLFYFLLLAQLMACQPKEKNTGIITKGKEAKSSLLSSTQTHFGEYFERNGAISTQELLTVLGSQETVERKVKAKIIEVCQVKGCWMNVSLENGEVMKVFFKDHAFVLPKKGMEGKMAVINGKAYKEQVSVADLKHYAEDTGKSAAEINTITSSKEQILFQATGVSIVEDQN